MRENQRNVIRCQAVAVSLAALGATAAVAAIAAPVGHAATHRIACGSERWTVKTLQDQPRLVAARAVSLHYLVTRPRPADLSTRQPFERRTFTVVAAVTLVRHEDDGDLHLVLRSGMDQMIAEAPDADCDPHATLHYRRVIALARNLVRVCSKARITGVAFFDFAHGQTGVAPNAIELHPILGFHCLA